MKNYYKIAFFIATILGSLTIVLLFESFTIKKTNDKPLVTVNDTLYSNINGSGLDLQIEVKNGKEHNHPTFAFWIEDLEGNFVQTLFVTKSLATGVYNHADSGDGRWKNEKGEARRPATLPYFLHKRGIKADDGTYLPSPEKPIVDTYTGATPKSSFILKSKTDKKYSQKFRLLMEINQPWDWNKYWNNTKFPDDIDYKTSCQPALVYSVTIDLENEAIADYYLNPIGHSHYSGKNGQLYTNLTTLTTALEIIDYVKVTVQ